MLSAFLLLVVMQAHCQMVTYDKGEITKNNITYKLYYCPWFPLYYAYISSIETTYSSLNIPGRVKDNAAQEYVVAGFAQDFSGNAQNLESIHANECEVESTWEWSADEVKVIPTVQGDFSGMPKLKSFEFKEKMWKLNANTTFPNKLTIFVGEDNCASVWKSSGQVDKAYLTTNSESGDLRYYNDYIVGGFSKYPSKNVVIPATVTQLGANSHYVDFQTGSDDIETLEVEGNVSVLHVDLTPHSKLREINFDGNVNFDFSTLSTKDLRTLIFKGTVTNIDTTFHKASNLSSVYFYGDLPGIDSRTFESSPSVILYVNKSEEEIEDLGYYWSKYDVRPIHISPENIVVGHFMKWKNSYTAEQIEDVARLRIFGKQDATDMTALKTMCDGTSASLRTLDLRELTLDEGLQLSLAGYSTLDTLYLPQSGVTLASGCFNGCKSDLVVEATSATPIATSGDDTFGAGGSDVSGMTLIVPTGSYRTYSTTVPWSYFGTIDSNGESSVSPHWHSYIHRSTEPGSFATALQSLSDAEQTALKSLTITGLVNSADLREIRRLCGVPFSWSGTSPTASGYNVHYLDMSEATFVEDNNPYMQKTSGSDSSTGYTINADREALYAFAYLSQLDTLWLPSSASIYEWALYQSNANMVVYTKRNEGAFKRPMGTEAASRTLVVPKGRTEYYSQYGFGTVVDGGYDGVGALTEPAPENLTLNICRGSADAVVSLKYNQTVSGETQEQTLVVPAGYSTWQVARSDAAPEGQVPYLSLLVQTARDVNVYCNGENITNNATKTIVEGGTLYEFSYFQLGFLVANTYKADIDIQFADAVITDVHTVRATSNSVDPRGIHVYAFDKDSDGRPTGSGQEYDTFGSIPVDKYVQVHFYMNKGNPYESNPTLTVNGGSATLTEIFDYTYSGNTYYRYDIPDLSVYPIWNLELTVKRWGEPRTDVVTHYVTMSDESGQAQATYSYNDAEGNVVSNPISPLYGSTFEMPKVTMDANAFVELQVRVPEGYKLHVYGSQYEQWPQSTDSLEEDGTQLVNYTFRQTTYDYRMVNQSFRIEVTESDPTVDWNVTLLGQVMVNMEFLTESETALDGSLEILQSGTVKANAKAKKLSLWVNYQGDYGDYGYDEFWDTKEVVVKADGQDLSGYLVQNDGGYALQEGYIPVDVKNVTNWIIGIKDKNSQTITWSLQAKGEVPEGASAVLALGDMQVAVSSEQPVDNQTVNGLSDGNYGMGGTVQVPAGYSFKLLFDGEDIMSEFAYDEETSLWTIDVPAADAARFNEDACLVIEFTKKPTEIIEFADANVKTICVENWDTDGDGELSKAEAAAVTTLKKDNGDGTFGDPVFKGNTEITSFDELQYFTGLTEIEEQAFRYCEKLTSVIVPRNVKVIQTEGFFHCRNLSVELPEGLTRIGIQAFGSCFYMKEIRLPESLERIERGGLESCFTIKTLYIPKNVNFINFSNGALGSMSGLISITVDPENTTYDSRNGCNAIIEKANNMLRAGCRNTKIPEGVTTIYGFLNQSFLASIEIPASVTSISSSTFKSCQRLTSVVSHIEEPFSFGTDAFRGISSECVLTVPYGTRDAYIAAGWTEDIFKGGIVEAPSKFDVNEDGHVSIADVTKLVNVILGKE